MDLSQLTDKERLKVEVAKDVVELGETETAIRRGRTRLGCTRKSLLKYVDWYKSEISRTSATRTLIATGYDEITTNEAIH